MGATWDCQKHKNYSILGDCAACLEDDRIHADCMAENAALKKEIEKLQRQVEYYEKTAWPSENMKREMNDLKFLLTKTGMEAIQAERDALKREVDNLRLFYCDTHRGKTYVGSDCRVCVIEKLVFEVERLRKAMRSAMDDLGVPQPSYPYPVAHAYDTLKEALAPGESSPDGSLSQPEGRSEGTND